MRGLIMSLGALVWISAQAFAQQIPEKDDLDYSCDRNGAGCFEMASVEQLIMARIELRQMMSDMGGSTISQIHQIPRQRDIKPNCPYNRDYDCYGVTIIDQILTLRRQVYMLNERQKERSNYLRLQAIRIAELEAELKDLREEKDK